MTFDKEDYWKNREQGKRGQDGGTATKHIGVSYAPIEARITFADDGGLVISNRAHRRRKEKFNLSSSQTRKKQKRK